MWKKIFQTSFTYFIRSAYSARPEFKARLRKIFLAEYSSRFPKPLTHAEELKHAKMSFFVRGMVVAFACVALFGGATSFADQQDVTPQNALYPLKRAGETVRGFFVSSSDRPTFHIELANRRLREMTYFRENSSDTAPSTALAQEFKQEVRASFAADTESEDANDASRTAISSDFPESAPVPPPSFLRTASVLSSSSQNNVPPRKGFRLFCSRMQEFFSTPTPEIRNVLFEDSEIKDRFQERCGFND